jgi:hypothetical protein
VEGLLDKEEWNKYMEDFVLWSFSQRDRRLRLVLLKNFDYYIHAFSLSQIEERIVPEVRIRLFNHFPFSEVNELNE